MGQVDHVYAGALKRVLSEGAQVPSRPGIECLRTINVNMTFDLKQGFPILSLKKVSFYNVATELVWMMLGSTDVTELQKRNIKIWNEWQLDDGTIGPGYGHQWRHWGSDELGSGGVDQLDQLIKGLKSDPYSRRHILNAWNVAQIGLMALPPCHMMAVFSVEEDGLTCSMIQRSGDMFLGVPYNIAAYALLTELIAKLTGLKANRLHITVVDAHIYSNHTDQVAELLKRFEAGEDALCPIPRVVIGDNIKSLKSLGYGSVNGDIKLTSYEPLSAIKAEVAV